MVLNSKLLKNTEISSIREIHFSILSPEEIERRSVVQIFEPNLYNSNGDPHHNGLFDQRMGVIERGSRNKCKTCQQTYVDCPGHFGHIKLAKPVYNMQFITQTRHILECVCNKCGKLLIHKDDPAIRQALKQSPEKRLDFIKGKIKTKICGQITGKKDDDVNENHGCGYIQPSKIGQKDLNHVYIEFIQDVKNEDTGDVHKEVTEMAYSAEMVLAIFKRINLEDAKILGFSPDYCLPYWLIYTVLPVAPPSVRPSVRLQNSQRSEDDITYKYNDIVKNNKMLLNLIENGGKEADIKSYNELAQCHVATLIDNNPKGVINEARHRTGRPLKTFKDRLKGKDGRVRGNLMGKRVDFSARSVISPDSSLDIDQLGVPREIAMNLTIPETVNKYNINRLYKLVRNGSLKYPGANSYTSATDNRTNSLEYRNTRDIVLRYGDTVSRHLLDEDVVQFNRQPTLHKMSMMAHRVKVLSGKTFRICPDVCAPYNADFDGDEMNMHVPQSIQTMMELKHLASVKKQIISPSSNSPIIKPSQDNLLGLYKITEDTVFFNHKEMMNLMSKVKYFKGTFPPPAIIDGNKVRWTGKQAVSLLLPPINFKNDSVHIVRGQILNGRIAKGESGGIIHAIFSEFGFDETSRYINDLQRVIKRYMVRSGFSIGMSDLIVHKDLRKNNEEYILEAKKDVIEMTKQVHLNIFENITRDIEKVYEAKITQRLSKTSDKISSETTNSLTENNNRVKYMVNSGSKGSSINIMQMMCLVDQQIVDGKRIPLGFSNRSLPHFLRYDNGIESKGYVVNSYLDGLTPTEFFFHAEGGREGLMDTAVKTAKSGYLQRKLIKMMEDLRVEHDYTVRNSNNKVIQFVYGNDAFDAIHLQNQKINNLILPDPEIIKTKYLLDTNEKWDKWLDKKSIARMVSVKDWKDKFETYNENLFSVMNNLGALHQNLAEDGSKIDEDRKVQFPVNFATIIENVKNVYHLDGKNKSDINPLEIIEAFDKLYEECKFSIGLKNPIFEALMIEKLSPTILIKDIKMTKVAFEGMLNMIRIKYKNALVQGGNSIGPIAAQSIGELSTQLTLNTFHLAGVGSKSNVNKGVPRLEELLEQHKPKHPKMTVFLTEEFGATKEKADQVRYNIELVSMSDILKSDAIYFEPTNDLDNVLPEDREIMKLYQVFSELDPQSAQIPNNPWIIRLEFNRHNMIEKKITMEDIHIILKHHMPKSNIVFADDNSGKLIFRLRMDFNSNENQADDDILLLNEQIRTIKDITIKGVSGVSMTFTQENNNKIEKDGDYYVAKKEHYVTTDGTNLFDILAKPYVDSTRSWSNHIAEMYEIFGIEAARVVLEREITSVFVMSKAYTNPRHIKLLCDAMTNMGKIMATNRICINHADNEIGPLAKSSFEETTKEFKMAGLYGVHDYLRGVSSNIMVGQIPKCGTGYTEILLDEEKLLKIDVDDDYSHVDYQDDKTIIQLLDGSDYCAENNLIQFNINSIEADDINLDYISMPIQV